jgi:hypothetical protein
LSNGERAPYDTELDGSPVVGDLLKIKFVEHQVVPTILVSVLSILPTDECSLQQTYFTILGLLLPLSVEQLFA